MAVAISDAIEYNEQVAVMPSPPDIAVDAPRYVVCLGDFIEAQDKVQLKSAGARSGGMRIGSSSSEGCPTMWRTNYMIRRAAFTPLEMTVVMANADEFTDDALKPKKIDERVRYPGQDMVYLTDDSHREEGIIEIAALRGKHWADETAKNLNRHFFPDINAWLRGEKEFPKYLRIYEDIVGSAIVDTEDHMATRYELLECARAFRVYAARQIEYNRQRILSTRNVDMGGFNIPWSGRARLFAEQLELTLENENEVVPVTSTSDDRQIAAMERANELKERELAMLEAKIGIREVAPIIVTEPEIPAIVLSSTQCSAVTKAGRQCQRSAIANGRCALPTHKL